MSELLTLTTENGNTYSFHNESVGNRSGFYHKTEVFVNGCHLTTNKVQYYNRTWESYRFQTSMCGSIRNLKENHIENLKYKFKTEKGYKVLTEKRREEFEAFCETNEKLKEYNYILEKLSKSIYS